jgi:hypothetical protein
MYRSVGQMSGSLSALQDVAGMPAAKSAVQLCMLLAGFMLHSVAQSPFG